MIFVFSAALAIGIYLTAVAGPAIVVIGLASITSAVLYTGGPFPLGYNGLGDVFVLVFFGFVAVCGTAFAEMGSVPALAVWASVPVGALATCILVVNNVRDGETDVKAGKRTLVVRFGRAFGLYEYAALVACAYVVPVGLAVLRYRSPVVLLPFLTLPVALRLARNVFRDSGRALNATLVGTARLLFLHSVLFALGLVFG
jgi:1,4-dihydroxy-2-naphthoate octaprenyltransferase